MKLHQTIRSSYPHETFSVHLYTVHVHEMTLQTFTGSKVHEVPQAVVGTE